MSKKYSGSNLTFIILSAGCASRGIPKSLIDIDDFKLIDYQTSIIKKSYPLAEIVLVCGLDSKKIIKYVHSSAICSYVRIIENSNYKSTSSLSSLKLAINSIKPCNIFVMHGDRIINNEAININNVENPFIVIDKNNDDKGSIGVAYQNNTLRNMSYGLDDKWGELFYAPYSLFTNIREYCNSLKSNSNIYELINILNDSFDFSISDSENIKIQPI